MNIGPGEREITAVKVIPINIYQGNQQALRLEVSLFMNTFYVCSQVNTLQNCGIKICLLLLIMFFLLDEILQK